MAKRVGRSPSLALIHLDQPSRAHHGTPSRSKPGGVSAVGALQLVGAAETARAGTESEDVSWLGPILSGTKPVRCCKEWHHLGANGMISIQDEAAQ